MGPSRSLGSSALLRTSTRARGATRSDDLSPIDAAYDDKSNRGVIAVIDIPFVRFLLMDAEDQTVIPTFSVESFPGFPVYIARQRRGTPPGGAPPLSVAALAAATGHGGLAASSWEERRR